VKKGTVSFFFLMSASRDIAALLGLGGKNADKGASGGGVDDKIPEPPPAMLTTNRDLEDLYIIN
jgi:hypothetical protein